MFRISFLLLAGTATSLSGCEKGEEQSPPSLLGTWQLTHRSCYCMPAPPPNEKVIFTAPSFSFYRNDPLTARDTYAPARFAPCGGSLAPSLHLTASQGPLTVRQAVYILVGNKLVLDYGGACDAQVDTYELLP